MKFKINNLKIDLNEINGIIIINNKLKDWWVRGSLILINRLYSGCN